MLSEVTFLGSGGQGQHLYGSLQHRDVISLVVSFTAEWKLKRLRFVGLPLWWLTFNADLRHSAVVLARLGR